MPLGINVKFLRLCMLTLNDRNKIGNAVVYIASHVRGRLSKTKLLKLLYLMDEVLSAYGDKSDSELVSSDGFKDFSELLSGRDLELYHVQLEFLKFTRSF